MSTLRAIDTNVVVRLLLRDDPDQAALVDALVEQGELFIPYTVLIETEWVLRAAYRLGRARIAELLRALTLIDGIAFPDRAAVSWASDRHATGADFADMIHLIASDTASFLSFDRSIARSAGDTAPLEIETLA